VTTQVATAAKPLQLAEMWRKASLQYTNIHLKLGAIDQSYHSSTAEMMYW
jgi:hypothetical protein